MAVTPRKRHAPAIRIVVYLLCTLPLLIVFLPTAALAVSSTLVISQVYGGGGNSGATYTHDFIEIFNRGTAPVDLTDWTVQYASSAGITWAATALAGSVPPGGYYLIQEAQGSGGTTGLPTPDVTGGIAMSAASGKVVLVSSATLLSGACPSDASIVDRVGYGSANCHETAPVGALTNTTAALRNAAGCVDTDNNSLDFTQGAPTPRNSSSPTNACQYTLDVTISPLASGTVTRSLEQPTYAPGTNVDLTAIPAIGYQFVAWSGDATGSANPITVLMNANKAITATFAINTYTLTVTVVGNGTVSKDLDQPAYDHGTPVNLTATAATGWHFVAWSGDAAGSTNPLALLMDASKSVVATFAETPPPPLMVISQVYGGGGNSGATYTHDFIEIFNRGTTAADLTGWTIQYASSAGTTWSATALSGSVPPGGYYLIQEAQGSGGTVALPTPEATGDIAMSAANAKVALVSGTALLSGDCPSNPSIVDLVGYGSATCSETAPAATLSNTTAALRNSGGCVDTDTNSLDFTEGAPTPRNSSSPTNSCQFTLDVTVDPAAGGSVSRSLDQTFYQLGTSVTLTATRTSGYHFTGWSGDATGLTNPITVVMNTNLVVVANFLLNTVSPDVVICQIYGGGGNLGATYTHDFIELFNRGNKTENITGWTLQYASAGGDQWFTTTLVGSIPTGGYYLIQEAQGSGGTVALPAPDAIGTIGIDAVEGKLALVDNLTVLAGECPSDPGIVDFVGYGDATCFKGAPAAGVDNVSALFRGEDGCKDTGNNSDDFAVGDPNPRNSGVTQGCPVWLAAGGALATRLELGPLTPNPFQRAISIRLALPRPTDVHLRVFDLQGRVVATLAEGALPAGRHDVTWNGGTVRGPAGAGIYFVMLDALGERLVRKVAIAR